jgi:hypothetical protein
MENFFGGLAFGLLMLANMIGLCGLFACYVVMPLHTLWLIFRKFVPSKNFICVEYKISRFIFGYSFSYYSFRIFLVV